MEGPLALIVLLLAQAAQAPDAPRRVQVVVRQHLVEGDTPVEGIEVALGCSDVALVGPPGSAPILRTVRLDARGRAEVELELPRSSDRRNVWAQVVEPGYQQHVRCQVPGWGEEPIDLVLPVLRGGTLHGIVQPASGGPARVALRLVPVGPSDVPAPRTTPAEEGGRFRVHFDAPGRYHLMGSFGASGVTALDDLEARSADTWTEPASGLAVLRDLDLDPARSQRDVELALAPGLTLAGRVLDPDGEPVYPFRLGALLEGFALADAADAREVEWSWGLYGGPVVTDPGGRFEIRGLPPGRYSFVGRSGTRPLAVLSPALHAAGERDVRVEARVHRIQMQVRDHTGAQVDLERLAPQRGRRGPGDPLLVLAPAQGDAWIDRFPIERSTAHLTVDEGMDVRLAFSSERHALVERIVRVPARPWLLREELQLAPPLEPARLALRVVAGGLPHRGPKQLALLGPSGTDVAVGVSFLDSAGTFRVPPGRYHVLVRELVMGCGLGGLEEEVPALGPALAVDVSLAPGGMTSLDLALSPNARLAVELALPRAGSRAEIEAALGAGAEPYAREDLRRIVHGARVELTPLPSGPTLAPRFRVAVGASQRPDVGVDWVAPGRESVSVSGIAPGAYRLSARLHDGRRLERTVELAGGSTTTVVLEPH